MALRSGSMMLCAPLAMALLLADPLPARAAVIPLTAADFGGTSLITFNGIATGTPANGVTIDSVLFNYLVNNALSNALVIDEGPGLTNNVAAPLLTNLNFSNANAVLRLTFAQAAERIGYGFAVNAFDALPNVTTVVLYDATGVMVGVLSAAGTPDPIFTGGFLGLRSTIPFVRADITFTPLSQAFALDNLRFAPASATIPEPASVGLLLVALAGVAGRLRHRS